MKIQPFYPLLLRLLIIITLIAGTVILIMIHNSESAGKKLNENYSNAAFIDSVNKYIDSIYQKFQIESAKIRKSEKEIAETGLKYSEYRISIPAKFPAILLNRELNVVAKKFGGDVYGSEDPKKKTIILKVKYGNYVTHSILLTPVSETRKKSDRTKKRK